MFKTYQIFQNFSFVYLQNLSNYPKFLICLSSKFPDQPLWACAARSWCPAWIGASRCSCASRCRLGRRARWPILTRRTARPSWEFLWSERERLGLASYCSWWRWGFSPPGLLVDARGEREDVRELDCVLMHLLVDGREASEDGAPQLEAGDDLGDFRVLRRVPEDFDCPEALAGGPHHQRKHPDALVWVLLRVCVRVCRQSRRSQRSWSSQFSSTLSRSSGCRGTCCRPLSRESSPSSLSWRQTRTHTSSMSSFPARRRTMSMISDGCIEERRKKIFCCSLTHDASLRQLDDEVYVPRLRVHFHFTVLVIDDKKEILIDDIRISKKS